MPCLRRTTSRRTCTRPASTKRPAHSDEDILTRHRRILGETRSPPVNAIARRTMVVVWGAPTRQPSAERVKLHRPYRETAICTGVNTRCIGSTLLATSTTSLASLSTPYLLIAQQWSTLRSYHPLASNDVSGLEIFRLRGQRCCWRSVTKTRPDRRWVAHLIQPVTSS
jgi:hypothetical protein